jgi:hypothetical protein
MSQASKTSFQVQVNNAKTSFFSNDQMRAGASSSGPIPASRDSNPDNVTEWRVPKGLPLQVSASAHKQACLLDAKLKGRQVDLYTISFRSTLLEGEHHLW